MSKPKHSPGPWLANQDGDLLGPKTNAMLQYWPPDARLMAAAPDMLQALKDIRESFSGRIDAPKWGCPDCLRAIRCRCAWIESMGRLVADAIAKAEGL